MSSVQDMSNAVLTGGPNETGKCAVAAVEGAAKACAGGAVVSQWTDEASKIVEKVAVKMGEPAEVVQAKLTKVCGSSVSSGGTCGPHELPFKEPIGRAYNLELLKQQPWGNYALAVNSTLGHLITGAGPLPIAYKSTCISTAPKEDGTQFIMTGNLVLTIAAAALTKMVGGEAFIGHLTLVTAFGIPNANAALTEGGNTLSQLKKGKYSGAAREAGKCLLHSSAVLGCVGTAAVTASVFHTTLAEQAIATGVGLGINECSKRVWDCWGNEITMASNYAYNWLYPEKPTTTQPAKPVI